MPPAKPIVEHRSAGAGTPQNPLPTMGRIVHYANENGVVSPALVTFVYENDEGVDLTVFTRSGPRVVTRVKEAEGDENTSWRWPPRS